MKTIVKYKFLDIKKALLIYYLVVAAVMGLFLGTAFRWSAEETGGYSCFNGLEMSTGIFLFVVGLNSFKESFYLFLQNGVSRKTIWRGQVLVSILISLGMTCLDKIIVLAGRGIASRKDDIFVQTLFENYYQGFHVKPGALTDFLMTWLLYLTFCAAGYFLTVLYYRLNKAGKTIVSIGLYGVPFVLFPLADQSLFQGRLSAAAIRLFYLAMGNLHEAYKTGKIQFLVPVLTFLVLSAAGWLFCYLLMRRAIIKK